jgi:hypothetical protein
MTEEEIKALQISSGTANRKARAEGQGRGNFSDVLDACQLALIAYTDARIFQKKLVTRGEENAAWKSSGLDERTARMMIVVNSHVLDDEEVVVRKPFDYSW